MISPATHLVQCAGLVAGQQCRRSEVISITLFETHSTVEVARRALPRWRLGEVHALCPECAARGIAALTLSKETSA